MLGCNLTCKPQPLPLASLYVHGSLLSVAHYPKRSTKVRKKFELVIQNRFFFRLSGEIEHKNGRSEQLLPLTTTI